MQLAKGSAEDLPSGLAANFRAFDFTWLSIERVDSTDGFEKRRVLVFGEAKPSRLVSRQAHVLQSMLCFNVVPFKFFKSKLNWKIMEI